MKKKNILPLFLLLFVIANGYAANISDKMKLGAANIKQKMHEKKQIHAFEVNIKKEMHEYKANFLKKAKLEAKIVIVKTKLKIATVQCNKYVKQLDLKKAEKACANKRLWSAKLAALKRISASLK